MPSSMRLIRPDTPQSAASSAGHFTAEEKRKIFRGMVVSELEAGFLRYSRRQALIAYGRRLGLSEFDANLLIAEAQYHRDEITPTGFTSTINLETVTRPETWSVSLRIGMALAIAIFVDLLLIRFIAH